MGGILSQCICISNLHNVHFKNLFFFNYTSIKLEENEWRIPNDTNLRKLKNALFINTSVLIYTKTMS